ncbi:MAG TPA: ERF family protein [Allosphingosinicella sp.]|nr:ERF family protein [Allosphingosinicella sp.]
MAADTQDYAFPPKIAGAVVKVMAELRTLAKDHTRNDSGARYDFASIDDFLKHVRGPMADAGLFIIPGEARDAETQEVTKKDGKSTVMWNARFAFTLVHADGESYGPIYKGVSVLATGAQSAGSAQSYALKQFLRGLFLIPTGDDDDPDKAGVEIASKGEHQTDLQKLAGAIRKRIRDASDLAELGLRWSDSELDLELIKGASETAFEFLRKEYDNRKRELEDA